TQTVLIGFLWRIGCRVGAIGPMRYLIPAVNQLSNLPFYIAIRGAALLGYLLPKLLDRKGGSDSFNGRCVVKRASLEVFEDDLLKSDFWISVAFERQVVVQRESEFPNRFISAAFSSADNGEHIFTQGIPEERFKRSASNDYCLAQQEINAVR